MKDFEKRRKVNRIIALLIQSGEEAEHSTLSKCLELLAPFEVEEKISRIHNEQLPEQSQ